MWKLKPNITSHIVAWALPKEEIPITVRWDDAFEYTKISIFLPEDLEFREILNADVYEQRDSIVEIYKIKEIAGAPFYFGCVVSSNKIYEDLKVSREIKIIFYKDAEILHEMILNARIFRPLLEVLECPREITLDEDIEKELPLVLKFTGFGDIIINIFGRINGKLVTKGKSFLYEVIKRVISMENNKEEALSEIYVSPEFVVNTTKDILDMLENPPEDILESMEELRDNINGVKLNETIEDLLQKRIEEVILGMIYDVVNKNPVNNVKLSDGETSVSTYLEAPVETLELFVRYRDVIENEYPEILIPIKLEIKESKKGKTRVNIPIKIERWENTPFKNVRDMKIETN